MYKNARKSNIWTTVFQDPEGLQKEAVLQSAGSELNAAVLELQC